jgi:hypothetical protein
LLSIFSFNEKVVGLGRERSPGFHRSRAGKNFNAIIDPSLKGAGDIHFPGAPGDCGHVAFGAFGP